MRKNYVDKSRLEVKGCGDRADQLSYSYSCIDAFKENQTLINNLINIKPEPKGNTVQEEPLLNSLSGQRERPIYHPFYYSYSQSEYLGTGENHGTSETEDLYDQNMKFLALDNDTHVKNESDSENLYFDSKLLLQWIRYQFKYVNDLWPFFKSKDYFIPNLCRKSKEIKMEMLLNNIDKQSKFHLKKYVEVLQLSVEEKCSIRNESVIEIDITPIIGDKQRLQEFLKFLQNIESSSNNTNQEPEQNKPNIPIKSKLSALRSNLKAKGDYIGNVTDFYSLKNTELQQGLKFSPKPKTFQQKMIVGDFNVTERSPGINFNLLRSSEYGFNGNLMKPRKSFDVGKEFPQVVDPSPHDGETKFPSSKTPVKSHQKSHNSNTNEKSEKKQIKALDNYDEGEQIPVKSSSCKCLMHECREDYRRYKNQCLFGKGDEKSNNFIGYVQLKEKESRLKLHKCLSNVNNCKGEESIKLPRRQKIYRRKYRLHKNIDQDKSSSSNVTDVCFHNCQSVKAEDSEEVICEVNFSDADIHGGVQQRPVRKPTTTNDSINACFESLNYSFNSVSWTTISEPDSLSLSPGTNSSKGNNYTEHSRSKIHLPLYKKEEILKQPKMYLKNTCRQTETFEKDHHIEQVHCVNIVNHKKESSFSANKENLNPPDKNKTYQSFRTTLNEPKEEIFVSNGFKDFKRQTGRQVEPLKPRKKPSKLNILKNKFFTKSISAMMKGNYRKAKELPDDSTESSNKEFEREQTANRGAPMTKAQQSEITALIIENFEKVYKELKQQNSEITNLKKILYDRIYDD